MAVLPTPGASLGVWGTALNAWLVVAHNADGTLLALPPNWVNPMSQTYGAKGDGSTNDTVAIQAALTATPNGGTCYLPGGHTYVVNGVLTIPNNVTFRGDSVVDPTNGSIITVANAANLSCVVSDGSWASNGAFVATAPRIENIIINGNGANQSSGTGVGIAFCSYRGEVHQCCVNNTRGDGIRITNMSANGSVVSGSVVECRVLDNKVAGCGTGNLTSNKEGIAFRDNGGLVSDWWCTRNVVWEGALATTNGVGIYANGCTGAVCSENHLYGIGTHGIYMTSTASTRIVNNYVEFFGQKASSGACYGIYANDSGGGPGVHISGNNVNVDDLITGNTFVGLYLTNGGSNVQAFFSLGPNNFYTTAVPAATAVSIQNQGAATNFVVAGCPQMCFGFTSPYVLLNPYGTYFGQMFDGIQTVTYAATLTSANVDLTKGTTIVVTLTGNITVQLPIQLHAGMRITFLFWQDATGGRTVTWSNAGGPAAGASWINTTLSPALITTANKASAVTFVTDGYDIVQVV